MEYMWSAYFLPFALVPAPRSISLDKQLAHSVIISWKSPEFTAKNQEEVTAYHVYADGQFRTSVGDHEKLRALVENIDASKVLSAKLVEYVRAYACC